MNLNKKLLLVFIFLSISIVLGCSTNNLFSETKSYEDNEDINYTVSSSSYNNNNNNPNIETTNNTTQNRTLKSEQVSKITLIKTTQNIKLIPPKNNEIYFGAFPDFGGSEDNVSSIRILKFENLTNKKIAWAYFSQNWFNGIIYPKKAIHEIINAGTIPFVRLMPRSDEEQFHPEKIYSMRNIIDGKFDIELHQWANDAKKDFAETHIPLLVDFAVEMNGDWFSWSGVQIGGKTKINYGDPTYPDGPELYRDAYRHIIDIFRIENVTHVTWFFHVDINSEPPEEWNKAKYYYPGNDYIDWIGISCYGPQNPAENYWETFSEILNNQYKSIIEISSTKPLALLEFGVTDNSPLGKKEDWLRDAFTTILTKNYLNFSAISYWNELWEEEDNLWASIEINSSKESLQIFQEECNNKRFSSSLQFSNVTHYFNITKNTISSNKNINNNDSPDLNANLLFKSGFEEGVYIDDELLDDAEDYRIIRGSDVSPFSWPIDLFGAKDSGLHYISDENQKAIFSRIETTMGHNKTLTRALYQQENYENEDCTQCPYEILDITDGMHDLYIRYWIKLDKESITKKQNDLWRTFFEYKTKDYEKGTGFRLISFIYTEEDGIPYWHWQGDANPEEPIWEIDNKKIPVPLDEWFLTEFYWHWSENDDGRALWKVNGEVIGDHYGPTTRNSKPIDFIMLFQIYGNSNPKYQWIDDIEIWDNIPEKYNITSLNPTNTIISKIQEESSWFKPKPQTSWQWQLTGDIDTSYNVEIYDVDLFETPQAIVDELHAQHKKVICYISVGSWEDWRPDAGQFPKSIIGNDYEEWTGEKWLDISQFETFENVLIARLDLAVQKQCDGIEPDNIHGYQENIGFDITYNDHQI